MFPTVGWSEPLLVSPMLQSLDRYGEPEQLEQVIEKLGLSATAQDLLRKYVQ